MGASSPTDTVSSFFNSGAGIFGTSVDFLHHLRLYPRMYVLYRVHRFERDVWMDRRKQWYNDLRTLAVAHVG